LSFFYEDAQRADVMPLRGTRTGIPAEYLEAMAEKEITSLQIFQPSSNFFIPLNTIFKFFSAQFPKPIFYLPAIRLYTGALIVVLASDINLLFILLKSPLDIH